MKKVDELPPNLRGGGETKYDYDTLFDGNVWCMERGEDFEVKPNAVGGALRAAAKRRGVSATIAIRGDQVFVKADIDG